MKSSRCVAWCGGWHDTLAILNTLEAGHDVRPIYLANVDSRLSAGREVATMRALTGQIRDMGLKGNLADVEIRSSVPQNQKATQAYNELLQGTRLQHRMPPHWEMLARLSYDLGEVLTVGVSTGSRAMKGHTGNDAVILERFWQYLQPQPPGTTRNAWKPILHQTWTCGYPTRGQTPCGACRCCRNRPGPYKRPKDMKAEPKYGLSVIYSVKDRSRHPEAGELFPRAIDSVLDAISVIRHKAEIVVVDWESTDWPVKKWLPARCKRARVPLTVISRKGPHNLGAGRNAGAAVADGRVLLFLDSDMLVSADVLDAAFKTATGGAVYMPICYSLNDLDGVTGCWRGTPPTDRDLAGRGSCGNMAIAPWLFDASGRWSEATVGWGPEDVEYRDRIVAKGMRVQRKREPLLVHQWHPKDESNPEVKRGHFPPAPMPKTTMEYLKRRGIIGRSGGAALPKVLLICDVPGWAFDRNHGDMAKALSGRYMFDHWYVSQDDGVTSPDLAKYDCIMPAYHFPINESLPPERTLFAQNSQYLWLDKQREAGPHEVKFARKWAGFYVTNKRAQEQYAAAGMDTDYLTNPVAMERHPKATDCWDVVRACWAGNSQRTFKGEGCDSKHFADIVRPACEQAGILLTVADYHRGRIAPDKMPEWYRRSNAYICASSHEGCSNSVMEALATGLILVTTDAGSIPEIRESQIEHYGESGIFVCDMTEASFAAKLKELSAMPIDDLKRLGELNRREIKEHWAWDNWADRYADAIGRVARGAAKGPAKDDSKESIEAQDMHPTPDKMLGYGPDQLRVLVVATQAPGYGGAATSAYQCIKELRRAGVCCAGVFIDRWKVLRETVNSNLCADPDQIGGCLEVERPGRGQKVIIPGKYDVIMCKNYMAPQIVGDHGCPVVYKTSSIASLAMGSNHQVEGRNLFPPGKNDYKAAEACDAILIHSSFDYPLYFDHMPKRLTNKIAGRPIYFPDLSAKKSKNARRKHNDRQYDLIFIASSWSRSVKNGHLMKQILEHYSDRKAAIIGLDYESSNVNHKAFGLVDHATVCDILADSRCLVIPSHYDSSPGVYPEAIVNGCNIVVGPQVGNCEGHPPKFFAETVTSDAFIKCIDTALGRKAQARYRKIDIDGVVAEIIERLSEIAWKK